VPALAEALAAHRDFAGLGRVLLPRGARDRPLAAALRPLLLTTAPGVAGRLADDLVAS
jgi:hypothetical protein